MHKQVFIENRKLKKLPTHEKITNIPIKIMINVSEIFTTKPENYKTPVQKAAYETLEKLSIPFGRVDCDEAITMDDCLAIDEALKVKVVKTLLLCNRQQTAFYLFITPGDKHFSTKDFSSALGISRVSFAPSEQLGEKLGVTVGATTIFGMLNGSAKDVKVVFDRAVLSEEYIGLSDGTTTGYLKMLTRDLTDVFLPAISVQYETIF